MIRIRYLGSAPQWGDGGEFHGWEVTRAGRWHPPAEGDEQALVRRCIGIIGATPAPAGMASAWPFSGPIGAPVEGLDKIEEARELCRRDDAEPDETVDALERRLSELRLASAEDLACDALGPGGDHSICPACLREGPRTWAEQLRIVPYSEGERRQGWKGGRIMLGEQVLATYAPGLAGDALALVRMRLAREGS